MLPKGRHLKKYLLKNNCVSSLIKLGLKLNHSYWIVEYLKMVAIYIQYVMHKIPQEILKATFANGWKWPGRFYEVNAVGPFDIGDTIKEKFKGDIKI